MAKARAKVDPDAESSPPSDQPLTSEDLIAVVGHPRGTLLIVFIYGLLFALGWLALYFGEFLPRGMP